MNDFIFPKAEHVWEVTNANERKRLLEEEIVFVSNNKNIVNLVNNEIMNAVEKGEYSMFFDYSHFTNNTQGLPVLSLENSKILTRLLIKNGYIVNSAIRSDCLFISWRTR